MLWKTGRKRGDAAMKKLFCIGLICAMLLAFAPAALAQEEPLLAAQSAILADMDTGAVLYERNADERCAPASLTKIMTVLLAVEAIEAGEATRVEYLTADADFRAGLTSESSNAGIQAGERLRMEELLYCAMLQSANESCNMLAVRLAGSVEAFAERMNERAAELGCTGTHFVNPNGLSDPEHYSTARDLLRISREAMSHELFAEICGTARSHIPATNMSGSRELENTNALINAGSMYGSGYVYSGAFGVKTGYTADAGYCLVSAVERDGTRLMAVVLGCAGSAETGYGNFSESIRLYDWAFDGFERRLVLDPSQSVRTAVAAFARGDVTLYPAEELRLFLPKDEPLPAVSIEVREDGLTAPIPAGTVLGEASVSWNGAELRVPLVTRTPVERDTFRWVLHRLVGSFWFWLAAVLLLLAAVYVMTQRAAARRRRRRRQQRQLAAQAGASRGAEK